MSIWQAKLPTQTHLLLICVRFHVKNWVKEELTIDDPVRETSLTPEHPRDIVNRSLGREWGCVP